MSDVQKQPEVVTFTANEWRSEDVSEALGVRKAVPKKKEPTPGMKAILVFEESFRSAKKQMKAYPAFWPTLDLPELISSMIDVCAADPELMEHVIRNVVERRKAQLAAMETGATPTP